MTHPPAQQHSATSKDAAERIKPSVHSLRAQVLIYLERRGPDGATDIEMQQALAMDGNTQRPRRIELVADGSVVDSGRTRRTDSGRQATVWVAADGGAA